MKTSISSYSFSALYRDGFTIFDAIRKTKELGLEGFEIAEAGLKTEGDLADFLLRVREEAEKNGLPIPCYTVSGNMLTDDPDREVERLCRQADMAKLLGAPVMRHDVAYGLPEWKKGARTFEAVLPRIAEGVRRVTAYASSIGVKTCMENHGFFAQDSDRVLAIVTAVDHDNYGVLGDMGNFTCADERPDIAFAKVLPNLSPRTCQGYVPPERHASRSRRGMVPEPRRELYPLHDPGPRRRSGAAVPRAPSKKRVRRLRLHRVRRDGTADEGHRDLCREPEALYRGSLRRQRCIF